METKQRFFQTLCTTLKRLDPQVFEPLKAHQSKTIHLDVHDLLSLYIQIGTDSLILLPDEPSPNCHTTLSGRLSDFMFAADPDPASIRQGNLILKGDLAFAQTFSICLKQMDCDWEGFFADKMGDNAAHFCGRFFQKASATLQSVIKRRSQDVVYYAQDETHFVPYPEEVKSFYADVDKLKCDVERFEAKLKSIL